MDLPVVRSVLAWCSVLDIAILLIWFLGFVSAHDWIYRTHGKWFKLSEETFSALHYGLIGFHELSIFIFLLGPYFRLQIVGGR